VLAPVKGNNALDRGCAPRHPGLTGEQKKMIRTPRPKLVWALTPAPLDKTHLHISWKAITNARPEQRTGLSSDDVLRVLARARPRRHVPTTTRPRNN
jgi:hypothetical protein